MIRILLAFALFALSACTPSAEHKVAMAMQEEGTKRINEANASIKDLNDAYGINLNPLNETMTASARAQAFDCKRLSEANQRAVMAKLLAHTNNITRIVEITRDKDVRLVGDEAGLKRTSEAAWQYYLSVEKCLKMRRSHKKV